MDTEHRVFAELPVLKDALDDALLDQVAGDRRDPLHAVQRGGPAVAYRPEYGDGMPHPDRPHRRAARVCVIGVKFPS